MAEIKRAARVAQGVLEELSRLLREELSDPRLEGVVFSRATMTDDLRLVRVGFRFLDGTTDAEREKRAALSLDRAKGKLRRDVTQRLSLRFAPELAFTYDRALEKNQRIEELLEEVRREKP